MVVLACSPRQMDEGQNFKTILGYMKNYSKTTIIIIII